MSGSDAERASLVEANRLEYGERYAALRFAAPGEARAAQDARDALLARLGERALLGYRGTKIDCRNLSPGCAICGEGTWSCLFVFGKCNCRCFYCPSEQSQAGVPTTNAVPFPGPRDYADYVAAFGYRGVGLSGGEPLLHLDATVQFATAVKRRLGDGVYVWVYTNGTRADPSKLRRLADAGVDEIRFDIGATGYDLRHLRAALGVIPTVTVEVPAVPEDAERMKAAMVEMAALGVSHLNLHQLRLTPHNFAELVRRPYTFLHGPRVTVTESERTALELLAFALDRDLPLPVNYCSFPYKDRHQRMAARRASAPKAATELETVTPAGYLRTLFLAGPPDALARQEGRFQTASGGPWRLDASGGRLAFHPSLLHAADLASLALSVRYAETKILPSVSYRNPFVEVPLNRKRSVVVERIRDSGAIPLPVADPALLRTVFLEGTEPPPAAADAFAGIRDYEWISPGLQDYY